MKVTIYHNPRCSKSRQTLQILHDNGIEPEIIKYLDTPPDKKTLEMILQRLNKQPRELMRKGEAVYKEANLDDSALTQDELIDAMLKYPILIERPIVVVDDQRVAMGRPPENVLSIIA